MTTPANPTDTDTHLRLLTLGALFDGEFSINWLHELSRGKPQHILEALDLGRKNEWTTSGRPGFFVFKDREKQMALKESLAPKEREKCYRRITDVLLEASLEDPEIKEALARSLLNVENDMDGCRRLYAEGESIARQNREPEALPYYIKAIKDLGRLNGKEADRLLLETTIEYALVSMTELETEQVISDIRGALERAESRSFVPQRALLKTYLAVYEFFRSEFESARLNFEEGLALAKDLKDEKTKRSIRFLSVVFLFFQGQYRETLNLFEEFVPEIDRVPQVGVPIILRPQHGSCLANCGQVSQGLGMVRATIHIGRKLKSSFVTGLAEFAMGRIYVDIGRFGEAVEVLESALEKAEGREHSQFKAGVLMFLAYANHKLGRNEPAMAALTELQKTTGPFQARSNPFPQIMHLCWSMDQGKLPRLDGYDLEQQISKGLRSPNVYMKGMAYRHKALIAKKAGRPNREVIEEYRHALKWLEMSGHEMGIAKIKLELAGEYLASGDEEQARSLGEPAIKFLLSINRNLIPKELLHLEKEFRTSEAMLKEIFQLGQELVAIRDNRKLVGHIISTANRFTGTERGAIFLLEKDSDQLVLRASKNLTSEDVASPRFKDSMKIIVETSRSGEGQAIEFESPFKKEPPSDDPIGACICVPMILRNSAFGVLYHDHFDSQKGFKDTDLEVLNYFAAQAAIAMDNAQAYEALEEMVEKQQEKSRYFEAQYLEHQSFENIVGKSPAIQQVFHHIESVAATDTTVLVLGETGVGKELVARAIHRNSPRQAGPFIRVNCSAFTENLIASELFGHEKGAFTGAVERAVGRFELADGGTLFLDEIGDIPMETQIRLLRVLQSKEFERVGGHKTLASDFRLLAATNRDLEKEVQAGRFRQDLYFRLNVFPIHVPALRERREDIPLLAYHFLQTNTKKLGKTIKGISNTDLDKLKAYHWPGNIRELENIVERGVILSSGPVLQLPDAGFRIPNGNPDSAVMTHKENERAHILRALKKTGGQLAGLGGAAEILSMNPSTLRYRLKKLGIQKTDWTFVYAQNDRNS